MTNPTRVAAGVPTGGQFAASAKSESGVALDDVSAAAGGGSRLIGPSDYTVHGRIDRLVCEWQDRVQCADIVNVAAATADETQVDYDPSQAAFVVLQHTSDYDNGDGYTASVFDADGNEIGWVSPPGGEFHARDVPEEFRPDEGAIDHDDADLCLDVAKVRAFDWANAERDYLTGMATTVTSHAHREPVWPQDDTERAAFGEWQREAADGDTAIDFRTWLKNKHDEEPC